MPIIYHVTSASEWKQAQEQGAYEAPSLKTEGFIHCSETDQVAGVLERYFAGRNDLVKLHVNTDKLTSRYVQEWSNSVEDTFPHIYGPINLDAVEKVETI
ncbi:DUF952 domain-containing protein [Terrimonas sp. NA20]|uniref:DUF952 domain-containing protein n=1 Tax=Terrimonas ginsenosidimutans TaxID=2908004 RepID=A0ABS9KTE9_9BACT|nr:DUF952 domain-containing protein [Terrimonas ginsenosidimutans]MCG2615581.1 DUF952 domain-containing protein [Terrimonas ginsenosidimutans]